MCWLGVQVNVLRSLDVASQVWCEHARRATLSIQHATLPWPRAWHNLSAVEVTWVQLLEWQACYDWAMSSLPSCLGLQTINISDGRIMSTLNL